VAELEGPAAPRRPAGEARGAAASRASEATPIDWLRDEQAVLSAAVQRLRDATGAELAAAWALRAGGAPYLAAAAFRDVPPPELDAEAYAAAAARPGVTLLGDAADPAPLRALRATWPSLALAPIGRAGEAACAVLGLASQRALRPRALADLGAAAARVAGRLAAARAAGRLAAFDAELARLDRLAALGRLAAEIAHEVRNPLVSVKTFLQLLPERGTDPEFITRFLAVATEELARVERLLDTLVGYPRAEDGAPAAVEAALRAVEALVRPLAARREVVVEVACEPDLPAVAAAADPLRQLLLNLALNAVEATPPQGRVELRACASAGGVEIAVADQGRGIPPAERERAFEPFRSGRGAGHGGLGLALARRIAEGAGGSIRIDDAPLGGALLLVSLPSKSY
jgi:signal transduction histidine kinase